jgi:hypothetical protein
MAKVAKVKDTLKDAGAIKTLWQAIPDLKVGNITLDEFSALQDETSRLEKEYAAKDVELTGVKGHRDDKALELSGLITRFRSCIRGTYGSDSPQFQQAGGTRDRDRKTPRAKAKPASV